jgi:hypothetical protein
MAFDPATTVLPDSVRNLLIFGKGDGPYDQDRRLKLAQKTTPAPAWAPSH